MEKTELARTIDSVLSELEIKEIKTEDQYKLLGEWLVKVKQTEKAIDMFFKPIKDELNKKKKELMDEIHRFSDPLKKAESIVKAQRTKFKRIMDEKKEKEREEMAKLVPDEMVKEIVPEVQESKGIYHVTVWKWEVENRAEIPSQYFVLDEVKINRVVRTLGEAAKIPGLKIYAVTEERVRV